MNIKFELVGSKNSTTLCFDVSFKDDGTTRIYLDMNYILMFNIILEEEGSFGQLCVKVKDSIFFLRQIPMPKILNYDVSTQSCTYLLTHLGEKIEELGTFSNEEPLILKIIKKEAQYDQLKSLILPIKSLPIHYKQLSFIDAVFVHLCVNGKTESKMYRWEINNWKKELENILSSSEYCNFIDLDGRRFKVAPTMDNQDEYSISCINEAGGEVVISAMTFMRFEVKVSGRKDDPVYNSRALPLLQSSFGHELTDIGKRTLFRFERELYEHYKNEWCNNFTILAPLISLCQSSGTGKSKIIFETIKRNLGFYLVFRMMNQTGYPLNNEISSKFYSLITDYNDDVKDLDSLKYDDCTVGKILNFIASIITKYMRDLMEKAKSMPLDEAIKCLCKRFETNESLTLSECALSDQEMSDLYLTHSNIEDSKNPIIMVKNVAKYIHKLLLNPLVCFKDISLDEKDEKIVEQEMKNDYYTKVAADISRKLENFPFIFVFDEAELLAKQFFNQRGSGNIVTGFQVLRRALSYIEAHTRIIAVTLGTNSNIIDLNPPIVDNSFRFNTPKILPEPIILSGNLNIFSKEYSVKYLKPSYALFTNQIFFKYLVTRGHAIWSSLPYDQIIDIGKTKIKNGTSSTHDYVLAIWMILTGLAANPFSAEAKTLVSSHMAYLIDLRDDLKNVIVSYPSEPILAMVAHKLIDELEDDELFSVLKRKYEAVDLNCGNLAEAFAEMIVLRAIHKSPRVEKISSNEYKKKLKEIIQLAPALIDLWETETNVLEDTPRSKVLRELGNLMRNHSDDADFISKKESLLQKLESIPESPDRILYQEFSFYEVHTLGGTLSKLCGVSEADLIEKFQLPRDLLDSIITANHFVRLNRFSDDAEKTSSSSIVDERIAFKCDLIDGKILRLAALNFAGILMTPGYYGIDFGIPYCMKDDTFGFLAVQVKRAGSNLSDDVHKMQSRLHYMKCRNHKCGENQCHNCTTKEELKQIYENQVSVIISLDDDKHCSSFRTSIRYKFAKELAEADKREGDQNELLQKTRHQLSQVLDGEKSLDSLETIENAPRIETQNFFVPLAQKNTSLVENRKLMLSTSIWNDKFVKPGDLSVKDKTIPFVPDGFNHRQFTFTTRGWKIFEKLFTEWSSCVEIANDLLTGPRFFRKKRIPLQMKRKFTQDFSFSFTDYSDDLALLCGDQSKLDELDAEDGVISKAKKAEKDEKDKVTSKEEKDEKDILEIKIVEESKRKLPGDVEDTISKIASSTKKQKRNKRSD